MALILRAGSLVQQRSLHGVTPEPPGHEADALASDTGEDRSVRLPALTLPSHGGDFSYKQILVFKVLTLRE